MISTILEARKRYPIDTGTEGISILEPYEDSVENGSLFIYGRVNDTSIAQVMVNVSGTETPLPVSNGTFSGSVNITCPTVVTLSATNSSGCRLYRELVLDGDKLTASYELVCGFDPRVFDSDSDRTAANEAGNGIEDGFELLDGKLPAFVKGKTGADPIKNDSDGDGLTDYFEVVRVALTDPAKVDSDGDNIPDSQEDLDLDGLTNLQEQGLGTDPLVPDTDKDTLPDGAEITFGSDPLIKDTDGDGLDDASEKQLGTNPRETTKDSSGLTGSTGTYTTSKSDDRLGINLLVTGKADSTRNMRFYEETSSYYADLKARQTPLIRILSEDTFITAQVRLKYDPEVVNDPSSLAIFYYNESGGLYLPLDSTVDTINHTVTANITEPCMLAGFNASGMAKMYQDIFDFNKDLAMSTQPARTITVKGDINITILSRGANGAVSSEIKYIKVL